MAAETGKICIGLDIDTSVIKVDFDIIVKIIYLDLLVCSGKIRCPVACIIRDLVFGKILTVICGLFFADKYVIRYLVAG